LILFFNNVITEKAQSGLFIFTPHGIGNNPYLCWEHIIMLDKQTKQEIVQKFRQHEGDSGSTQVQIAILTEEIKELTEHLKKHRHDFSSRRGLLRKVGERRRLLKYLQKEDEAAFLELASRLNLRIAKRMAAEEEERKRLEAELISKGNLDAAEEDIDEPDIEAGAEE